MMEVTANVTGKSFLVTGAAGFIGRHLVRRLVEFGASEVIGLDRTPIPSSVPVTASITADLGLDSLAAVTAAAPRLDTVFHLAASKYDPRGDSWNELIRSNTLGTGRLIEALGTGFSGKFTYASTLFVYGRRSLPAFDENDTPCPTTVYGETKLAGERLVTLASETRGLRATTLRLMFVYGPEQLPKYGYPSVIPFNGSRVLNGLPAIVRGDGRQQLDYVYVDDVVEAFIRTRAESVDGLTLNIGSGDGTSIIDLVQSLSRASTTTSEAWEHVEADETAGTVRVANIASARRHLGWSPTTTLERGLEQTLEWLRTNSGADSAV